MKLPLLIYRPLALYVVQCHRHNIIFTQSSHLPPPPPYPTTMHPPSACKKPFRFLDLPKEIRLMVYEHLVDSADYNVRYRTAQQFQQSSDGLFDKSTKRLTFHESYCSLRFLRVCKTIYSEAKPTLQRYLGSRKYHVSCYGYSVLDLMNIFDNMFVFDGAHHLYQTYQDPSCLRRTYFPHTSGTVNLDFGSADHFLQSGQKLHSRIRAPISKNVAIHLDYYPMHIRADTARRHSLTQEDIAQNEALQQDLALLAHLKATGYKNLTVNIYHEDRLSSLEEYDRITNTPANFLNHTSRHYWALEFKDYREENGAYLSDDVKAFPRHWLLPDQLPQSPPRAPCGISDWIMLATEHGHYAFFFMLLGVLYGYFGYISSIICGMIYFGLTAWHFYHYRE